MGKISLKENMTRSFHKVGFNLKKHSPEILVVAGVIGGVASAVLACRATTKANLVLADTKKKVEFINEGVEKGEVIGKLENGEEGIVKYSEEDGKNDLRIVYAKTGLQLVKLYAPAVILGAASITSILAGHNILHKRNVALAAAYATVDQSFKDYRKRVVERFGEDLDRELKYNIRKEEIEEKVVNEDGTETTVKKTVNVGGSHHSPYAIFFDDTCTGWTRNSEKNKFFLLQVQNWANDRLKIEGFLFLNDVYEMLGASKTRAGQIIGWYYDPSCHSLSNCVDFDIFDLYDDQKRSFVNGHEQSILLDFNVDGNLLDEFGVYKSKN